MAKQPEPDQFSPEETKRRMEAAIQRAQTMPHKPQAERKAGPRKRKAKESQKRPETR